MPRETVKERTARRNAEAERLARRRAEIDESNRRYEEAQRERLQRLQRFTVSVEIEYDPLTRKFYLPVLCCGGVLPASIDMTTEYASKTLQMAAVVSLLPLVSKFAHGDLIALLDSDAINDLYRRALYRDMGGISE